MPRQVLGDSGGKPYSPGTRNGKLVFVSGQLGVDAQGKVVSGGIVAETRQTLENVKSVLALGGASLDHVTMVNIYLIDLDGDFGPMNKVYQEFFTSSPPARATVEVRKLALGTRVEISAIAVLD